ncbi:MAG: TssQ family T6SS-associated lipoprotein [Burkholderiaceae bacterium]
MLLPLLTPSLLARSAALLCAVLLSACTTTGPRGGSAPGSPPTAPGASPAPGTVPGSTAPPISTTPSAPITAPLFEGPSPGAAALNEGVAAFHKGEYGRADSKIKQSFLQGLSNTPDLLRGYKTIAFVNCITQRMVQCEKSFEAAIAIDRKFDLSASERNHPAWGSVFAKVRKRFPV